MMRILHHNIFVLVSNLTYQTEFNFIGSLFKDALSGLYAHGVWNVGKGGVAGNSKSAYTGVFVAGRDGKYPNSFVQDQGTIFSTKFQNLKKILLLFSFFCFIAVLNFLTGLWYVDYSVTASQAKIVCKSALDGEAIGLFIGPHIEGIWGVVNSSELTLYYDIVFISEEQRENKDLF